MFDFFKSIFGAPESLDLTELIHKKPFLVDVRTPTEYTSGHIKGAVNIPLDSITNQLQKFKGKQDVLVYCRSGMRSNQAKSILDSSGIQGVVNGGSIDYVQKFVK